VIRVAEDYLGARVRYWRLKRGISQKTLAELAGMTQGYVSQIEAGLRAVEKRSTLIHLAGALQVSVTDLTNLPVPGSPELVVAQTAVPAIRAVLNAARLGEVVEPRRTLDQVRDAVEGLAPVWMAARYDRLSLLMPELLSDLHALTTSADERTRAAALRLWVETMHCATSTLRYLHCGDLAMVAADLGQLAAIQLGEPLWQGVAEYVRLQTLPAESKAITRRLAVAAMEGLMNDAENSATLQVSGMLHLSAAFSAATVEDEPGAAAHLGEARRIAERTGEGRFATMMFGPTNVAFWETSIAVATGEGGRVVEIARRVNPDRTASDVRKAAYYIDYGRGLVQTRKHDPEALASFIRAERTAPQRTRRSPAAQEAIGTMLRRARANAGGRQLRDLASRIGVG
jgi:transcriptional regulator with XRE-family HTH domain